MSRFRFKGSFVAASAALLASSLLAACGPGEGEPAGNDQGAAEGELTPIDIGSIPVTDAAIMLLGDQQGFFEDEGLTAEVGNPTAGGSSVVAAIIAGEYEIGYSASLSVFQAIEGGNDLVFIANAVSSHDDPDMGTNDLIVSADSDFASAKDLEGKTVAVNAAGGFAEMLGKNSVLAAGGDPDQVQWVQLNFPDQLPALQSGQIDGFVAGEPFGTLAREDGESVLTNTL